MNKITFQIRLSPGGTHIAQAVENGKVIAVSTKGYTNGEEAINDVKQVLEEKMENVAIIYKNVRTHEHRRDIFEDTP